MKIFFSITHTHIQKANGIEGYVNFGSRPNSKTDFE